MSVRENRLSAGEIDDFRDVIYGYYRLHARDLPWRKTDNAYHIFISEIMLQQTQVARVTEKYKEFIYAFPDFSALAESSLSDVLTLWQGLGYNRRASSLLKAARIVTSGYGGALPRTVDEMSGLPGVGKATASAVLVYAFHLPVAFIETNVRRVFIGHFFQEKDSVSDRDILPLVEQTLDGADPRNWYYALMDYGAMMGKRPAIANPNRKSLHYRKQTPFKNSVRQVRGEVLRLLLEGPLLSVGDIADRSGADADKVRYALGCLEREGLVREEEGAYGIS